MTYAILATMRDEAPFLLEWLAYHRAIGFDRFVIYSNDCTDGTDEMLSALDRAGVVTHVPHAPSSDVSVAKVVADDARSTGRFQPGDWVIWLDADEFLNIHLGEGRIADLTARLSGAAGVCLSWRVFGDSGQETAENGFISTDFTGCAEPGRSWANVKTLFRQSDHVRAYFQHRPIMSPDFWDGGQFFSGKGHPLAVDGRQMKLWREGQKRGKIDDVDAGWDWAQINHYAVRTRAHFEAKQRRGRIGLPNAGAAARYTDDYFEGLNRNEDQDRSILRWRDATQDGIRELRELMAMNTEPAEATADFARYKKMHAAHVAELDERTYANRRLAHEIAQHVAPKTAVDVGCGIGILMSELQKTSVEMTGVEGLWLEDDAVVCTPDVYVKADLEQPLALGRHFDLCVSIEVAEHLEKDRAAGFVADLCALSDAVVFSAAIPGQGGRGHKNEQWQSYWAAFFAEQGYAAYDVFRPGFLRDPQILPWFRQNVLLYLRDGHPLADRHAGAHIPLQSCDMILPEYHRKAMRRTRRALKKRLDDARRALETS
ncbi:MAG: glycosyltransferase family 2 protein [Pseudomonadota bacterium]